MSNSSMLYTIGTALNRALDNGIRVQVLVEGQWLEGYVVAVDGFGVVLNSEGHEHSVVRMESISAVRIFDTPPSATPISSGAMPMSGSY
jgi:sRNA-binding regulator protein Hfq